MHKDATQSSTDLQLTAALMEQAKNKSCAEAEIRYRS
jgi:hypothetical protein